MNEMNFNIKERLTLIFLFKKWKMKSSCKNTDKNIVLR